KKIAITFFDEHVQNGLIERGIGRVAVQLPVAINQIDLDRAAQRFASIYANRGIRKIGSSFAIPSAELNDVDLVTGRAGEILSKLAGEPARLQLELVRHAKRKKKCAVMHTTARAHLRI